MAIQYFATNRKEGDGQTTVWDFSFAGARPDAGNGTEPYLDNDNVKVATVIRTEAGEEIRDELAFTFGPGPSNVTISPAVAAGTEFVIYRDTPSETPVADFTDYASIDEQDLDNSFRQILYVVQEMRDRLSDGSALAAEASEVALEAIGVANSSVADSANAVVVANQANSRATTALSQAGQAVVTANEANTTAGFADQTANDALAAAAAAAADVADAVEDSADALAEAAAARNLASSANLTASAANQTANTANTRAGQAIATADAANAAAGAATSTANAANQTAEDAEEAAGQALEAAGLIVGFQEQLDQIQATVEDLTGVGIDALTRNEDNLSKLTDFVEARNNLSVYSKAEVDAVTDPLNNKVQANEAALDFITQQLPDKADKSVTVTVGSGLTGGGNLGSNINIELDSTVVRTTRSIIAGNGMSGGGTLAGNRTITLGTPSKISGTTSNSVTTSSHTHELDSTSARTSQSVVAVLQAKAMSDHIASGDHDERYYTKGEVDLRRELVGNYLRTSAPRICRFHIYKPSNQKMGSGNTTITFATSSTGREDWSNEWYYPAAYWSTANHWFVAPTFGLYRFYWSIMNDAEAGGTSNLNLALRINGVTQTTTGTRTYGPTGIGSSKFYNPAAGETTLYLNAGDTVAVAQVSGEPDVTVIGSTAARYTYFGGILL